MAPDPKKLIDLNGLAQRLGVTRGTLSVWKNRGKLPEPDFIIGRSPAWLPQTIAQWESEQIESDE